MCVSFYPSKLGLDAGDPELPRHGTIGLLDRLSNWEKIFSRSKKPRVPYFRNPICSRVHVGVPHFLKLHHEKGVNEVIDFGVARRPATQCGSQA